MVGGLRKAATGVVLTTADTDDCGVPEPVGLRPPMGVELPMHAPSTRSVAAAAVSAPMPQMQQLTRVGPRYAITTVPARLRPI